MLFRRKKKQERLGDLYQRIDKKLLRYVTERDPETYVESVIGRDSRLGVYPNEGVVTVWSDGKEIFRGLLEGSEIGELMSLEGVSIKAIDPATGKQRSIVAYYKYYRKI